MILKLTIEVEDKVEAYQVVSELGFEHFVLEAILDGKRETFGKDNKPAYFLRDNKKNALPMISKVDLEENK